MKKLKETQNPKRPFDELRNKINEQKRTREKMEAK